MHFTMALLPLREHQDVNQDALYIFIFRLLLEGSRDQALHHARDVRFLRQASSLERGVVRDGDICTWKDTVNRR